MTLKIAMAGAVLGIVSITLVSQDEPQLTPRNPPKSQSSAQVAAPEQHQLASGTAAALQDGGNNPDAVTVPAGTRVPLSLKQGITTKNAKVGDPVYAQTSFPIALNDRIVIPTGTFVQGEIRRVQRPGKVKGRAELQMNFTSMIFPNGYTLMLPGAVQGTPGEEGTAGVKDKEGTIQGDSSKAKDAATIVGMAIPGAGIGAISDEGGGKGAAIGAASGGVLGLATVLLTRGPEIQLGVGASVEMVLERNVTIEQAKVNRAAQ